MEPTNDDSLDVLFREAARYRDGELAADPELRSALTGMRTEIMATVRPRRRLPWPRLVPGRSGVLVAASLATALTLGGVALLVDVQPDGDGPGPAASHSRVVQAPIPSPTVRAEPLHTGDEPDNPGTEDDRSEWLNLGSPELPAYIEEQGRVIPLPPGGDWSFAKKSLASGGGGRMQATGVIQTMVLQAMCQWGYYWRDAQVRTLNEEVRTARRKIEQISRWTYRGTNARSGRRWSHTETYLERPVTTVAIQQYINANCAPKMWPGVEG